jgi:carbamoyltransferase
LNILGLACRSHDAGIALLRDGKPLYVLEEERFNREKHTKEFPIQSLAAAFEATGLGIGDIAAVTIPWDTRRLRRSFARAVAARLPTSLNLLRPSAHATQDSRVILMGVRIKWELQKYFGTKALPPMFEVRHHDCHAASFFMSPFEEAAVLVMDGYGDDSATSAYAGRGNRLDPLWQRGFFDSLGALYTAMTMHLGFKPFEEGTVMALAACGRPKYRDKAKELIHLHDGGSFSLNRDYIAVDTYGLYRPFTRKFYETFGPPRQRHEPVTDQTRDLAFALQAVTEDAVLHIVRDLATRTQSRNLCLSGGVALNCVANARILRDTPFERVWVPPCASDTGAPIGSTLYQYHQVLGHKRQFEMTHAFYGMEYSDAEIRRALDAAGLAYRRMTEADLIAEVARNLADQKIVGWFQGRFEMGPRALGNRSILSDSRSLAIKDLINARVKHREAFRPFAPAVLIERAHEYFELDQPDPFMTLAPRVRPEKVKVIPAAVHVDGTGRIQTVARQDNPRYYAVIEAFDKLTGVPVILNTSFNRQEPVVSRPEEAISCYLRTDMDVLVLGDYYITDRNPDAIRRATEAFVQR